MGDVLPPGQMQLSANHQEQEDQPAISRLHPPRSDPGDSPLSQVLGHNTAEWPWMGNSHQRLCQSKQDARLPQKKHESLFGQDQGTYLQGTDPTHHWVRMCSVGTPQWQAHLQPWEGQEKGSTLHAEQTSEHLKCWKHAQTTEMVNPSAQMLDNMPHHAVQDHHWSSVCEVPWPQTPACKWKKPPQPPVPMLQLPHGLQKQNLPQHSQGLEQTPPRCSSVPHHWYLQVKDVIPLPINSQTVLLLFPVCITMNTVWYPKITVMASFVADGH